jgi:hypothetical protein
MDGEATPSGGAGTVSRQAAALMRLASFLLGRARRGNAGSSRQARQLRDAIRSAAADPNARPVLISGCSVWARELC